MSRFTWPIMVGAVLVVALLTGCARPRPHAATYLLATVNIYGGVELVSRRPVYLSAHECATRAWRLNASRPELYLCAAVPGVREVTQ